MANRLADATSLYLRQHAGNPVDWWPWSDAAFDRAERQGKPILLSIGYSACHWCHVMAHESFSDPATAGVMNELFVNIKLDREQRPDLDTLYQHSHQALSRQPGGWPLTVFLDAETRLPFFTGTYFPPTARHGLPAFVEVLRQVRAWHDKNPATRAEQANALQAMFAHASHPAPEHNALDGRPIRNALSTLAEQFDAMHGGQRGAPKFPRPCELALFFTPSLSGIEPEQTRVMRERTLAGMADGGLVDHLGGGFFRYSVDARWEIPHFEKMLYDTAQLLPLYARAARGKSHYEAMCLRAAEWLARDMQLAGGGFASSLDADSEGDEGRHYVWQRSAVRGLLPDRLYPVAARHFGLDQQANFDNMSWHLTARVSVAELSREFETGEETISRYLAETRELLFAARIKRPAPTRDDKVLCGWNALAIAGLAEAAHWLHQPALLRSAERALAFLRSELWVRGRLLACHGRGKSETPAWLTDHALLILALLAMLRQRWRNQDLLWACALADLLLAHFEDKQHGGFWFSADDAERLPARSKPFVDEALPAGNGAAARALLQLGHLLGETRYLEAAERCLRAGWPELQRYPQACGSMLRALVDFLEPPAQIVLRDNADERERWQSTLATVQAIRADVYRIPAAAGKLPGVLAQQTHRPGGCAWVCRAGVCLPVITEPEELQATMQTCPNPHPNPAAEGRRSFP